MMIRRNIFVLMVCVPLLVLFIIRRIYSKSLGYGTLFQKQHERLASFLVREGKMQPFYSSGNFPFGALKTLDLFQIS